MREMADERLHPEKFFPFLKKSCGHGLIAFGTQAAKCGLAINEGMIEEPPGFRQDRGAWCFSSKVFYRRGQRWRAERATGCALSAKASTLGVTVAPLTKKDRDDKGAHLPCSVSVQSCQPHVGNTPLLCEYFGGVESLRGDGLSYADTRLFMINGA
ncbi:MAG: hypothetical protein JWL90_4580 [Chthoniobacteraceae bacterium]|nr:hypothetical protein [Chthoniobacteraceae bacterium]